MARLLHCVPTTNSQFAPRTTKIASVVLSMEKRVCILARGQTLNESMSFSILVQADHRLLRGLPAETLRAKLLLVIVGTNHMAEARFDGMLDYFAALQKSCGGFLEKDALDPLLKSCMLDIERAPPITMEAGASMLRKLEKATVPQAWREALVKMVQTQVQTGAENSCNQGSKKAQRQTCLHLDNYFLKKDWEKLASDGLANKVNFAAQRMAALGLLNPTEPTAVHAVSILYLTSHKGTLEELNINGAHALNTVRDLKSVLRGLKGFTHSGITNYPMDPAELPSPILMKAFGQEKPEPSRLDPNTLGWLQAVLPARHTHTSVRGAWGKRTSRLHVSNNFQEMFMNAMSNPDMAAAYASMMRNNSGVQLNMARRKQLMPSAASAQVEPLMLANQPVESHTSADKQNLQEAVDLEISLPSNEEPSIKARPGATEISKARPAASETSKAEPAASETREALPAKDRKALPALEPKSVDAMASDILTVISGQKRKKTADEETAEGDDVPMPKAEAKSKPKAKAKATANKTSAVVKAKSTPPKIKNAAPKASPKEKKEALPFPGTAAHEPVRYKNATVYICPKSTNYRVKLDGEKKDKAFSWKRQDAKEAWAQVKEYILNLR